MGTMTNEHAHERPQPATDAALLELRLAGMTYRAIAEYVCRCGTHIVVSQVYGGVQRELARRGCVLVPVRRYELRPTDEAKERAA